VANMRYDPKTCEGSCGITSISMGPRRGAGRLIYDRVGIFYCIVISIEMKLHNVLRTRFLTTLISHDFGGQSLPQDLKIQIWLVQERIENK
jgi:hypothetical protein